MTPQGDYYLPKRQLINTNESSLIQKPEVPRGVFKGSWQHLTTFDEGQLIPFLVEEVLPGDHLTYGATIYCRMATPLFPMMSNQTINTFWFYVPNRILWENWVKLMGEQDNPGDSIAFTVPQIGIVAADVTVNSIYDHMGIPKPAGANQININALPLRAYNRIFNDWFRDENIINRQQVNTDNGPDGSGAYFINRRAKMHDYFTSCLPWPQKFTAPTVPLSPSFAPVSGIGLRSIGVADGTQYYENTTGTNPLTYAKSGNTANLPIGEVIAMHTDSSGIPTIAANLTGVNFSINVFRQAFMIQALLERDARGGTRYTEKLLSHFGVRNPDYRLQRPEYIGGGQTPLNTTPIANTSNTNLGVLGGASTGVGQHSASYAATEHGFIIGLVEVQSELGYQQGLHKMWTRQTMYDYPFPATALLGEQAVLTSEIFADGSATDVTVFGYQERWHEYRVRYSETSGYFRSTWAGTLDAWHLMEKFSAAPTLNVSFINEAAPVARVVAAGTSANNQQYLCDIAIRRTAVRPLPTFGTPALLGRF